MVPNTSHLFPCESQVLQPNDPTLQFYSMFNNLPIPDQSLPAGYMFYEPPSNSVSLLTFDEAEDNQVKDIDQKKNNKRIVSNRESARRSRMRKRMQLDELMSQLTQLRRENQNLVYKLKHVTDCHDRVSEENAKLKGDVLDMRKLLSIMPIERSCTFLEDIIISEEC